MSRQLDPAGPAVRERTPEAARGATAPTPQHAVLALQMGAGNAATVRALQRASLQRQPAPVDAANVSYAEEADNASHAEPNQSHAEEAPGEATYAPAGPELSPEDSRKLAYSCRTRAWRGVEGRRLDLRRTDGHVSQTTSANVSR